MSVTIGAALKKIAVALLADRKNWEKLAVALFAVLLLFLLPILSVEAIFQADMDWDSPGTGVCCAGGIGCGQPGLLGELQRAC